MCRNIGSIHIVSVNISIVWASFGVYLFYTKNGDINNIYRIQKGDDICKSNLYDKIREWYDDPNKVVERLHELAIYHTHIVKWPYYILLSVILSITLLLVLKVFTWINLIIAGVFIFLGLTISDHWYGTHVYGAHETEASFLHSLYRELTADD